MSIVRHR